MKMISLTFGVLPPRETFDAAFEMECRKTKGFGVDLNSSDSDLLEWAGVCGVPYTGLWDADDTWGVITRLTAQWESGDPYAGDECGQLASSILSTLGFEWV